ncbi:MAG TPA: pseudouridine synthase [Saprospiraceae bacterium]|nr:tRNA pseudouridine(65) synthase TruC [Saprospiraceae bacterium]MCB9328227.1 pseudouridylate synthase [Lewinellaceae bacterium]HPK09107.1 pseudouridine synthase [Saprospiraceae bacterium]HPQ21897.1 pseudouridine synthase [Saprospiraceae bacterium]HRX28784.1 pseudouridine synthase [Saprospiraceae bacterium]
MFEILFEDESIVAINKPYGYFVHTTSMDPYTDMVVLNKLRDQLGYRIYPVHRLDRKTSGILLFAKNQEIQSTLNTLFREGQVYKEYQAIVRGWISKSDTIDYDLTNDSGKIQNAITEYQMIQHLEIPISSGSFETSRYSEVLLIPKTGRYHQLRKHMAHIMHPIIGDRPHGCNKQNRFFKNQFQLEEMMLYASNIQFRLLDTAYSINANPSSEYQRISGLLSD